MQCGGPSKVALFVDIENLAYGLYNKYNSMLRPESLIEMANKYGQVIHVKCFGDFSQGILQSLRMDLVNATFDVVDVPSTEVHGKIKQYTDFMMLDDIYQVLMHHHDVSVFILGTGDGHFRGVASRLRIRHDKHVVLIGVRGTISSELQASADEVEYLEPRAINMDGFDFGDLVRFMHRGVELGKTITFMSTVRVYKRRRPQEVSRALELLIEQGKLTQETVEMDGTVRVLRINGDDPDVARWLSEDH